MKYIKLGKKNLIPLFILSLSILGQTMAIYQINVKNSMLLMFIESFCLLSFIVVEGYYLFISKNQLKPAQIRGKKIFKKKMFTPVLAQEHLYKKYTFAFIILIGLSFLFQGITFGLSDIIFKSSLSSISYFLCIIFAALLMRGCFKWYLFRHHFFQLESL